MSQVTAIISATTYIDCSGRVRAVNIAGMQKGVEPMKRSRANITQSVGAWSIAIGLCALSATITSSGANARITKSGPNLATTICHGNITAEFISKNKRRAFLMAAKKWRLAATARYGQRFSYWSKSKLKQIVMQRDRIEQSWTAIRSGRPCGPRLLTKR